MNSTPLNRNSDHDPLPQINLQEYGDPELFVEECKSKGGIDSNSSISAGLNENTFKSSLSTDLRMFDPLETKGNIQQPEIISSVDLLDMNYDTKVHTIDYMKSPIDDPVTCNASIWSPINVQNQSRKYCDDKTENEGADCNSTPLVANQTFFDALLCAVDAHLPDHDFDKSLDFSKDNIKYLQRNDDTLVPIISYLENGALPRLKKTFVDCFLQLRIIA